MMVSRVLVALLVLATAIVVCGSLGFRVNLTASLPLGVYRVSSEPPSRGSIVQVCLPRDQAEFARTRGYLGPGSCPGDVRPIGKVVLAVAGDVVTVSRDAIRLNGVAVPKSRIASEDSRGRSLPHHAWGEYRLGRTELWLFSPYHRNAYDSRYFGPVSSSQLVSVVQTVVDAAVTLLDHLRSLPPNALLPAGWLRDQLEADTLEPVPAPELVREAEWQTWRIRIWTCPPETRLGVLELEEALGRPRSWIYRRTSERAAAANGRHGRLDMIPHRKLGGELVFVAGDIRRWLDEHERVAVPASRTRS